MNVGNVSLILKLQNNLKEITNQTTKNSEKLASGIRINRAGDDVAGLKISEKMRSQIRGLDMAVDNATDGISMLQTAEGGLSQIGDLLQRMNELTIKASNGIHTAQDISNIEIEYEQCKKEIDRIAQTTTFNGKQLLNVNTGETKIKKGTSQEGTTMIPANAKDIIDFSTIGDGNEFIIKIDDIEQKYQFVYGNANAPTGITAVRLNGTETNQEKAQKLKEAIETSQSEVNVQIYADTPNDQKNYIIEIESNSVAEGQKIEIDMKVNAPVIKVGNTQKDIIYLELKSVTTNDLGIKETKISTTEEAKNATEKIAKAIETISQHRGKLGTTQNQIEYTIKRITAEQENITASESRIRDVDMAEEMVKFTKNQIVQQTAISMLGQANQEGAMVLRLLGNR